MVIRVTFLIKLNHNFNIESKWSEQLNLWNGASLNIVGSSKEINQMQMLRQETDDWIQCFGAQRYWISM